MYKRNWLAGIAFGLAASGCGLEQLPDLPEGATNASECRYQPAARAADDAAEDYASAKAPSPRASRATIDTHEELRRTAEITAREKARAKECEDREREWSDLLAQWQNARATTNNTNIARVLLIATVLEMALLLATVAVGAASIWQNHKVSKQQFSNAEKDAAAQQKRFLKEIDETRRISERQSKAYLLPVSARLEWKRDNNPVFYITYHNGGATPAINVTDTVLLADEERPPSWDRSTRARRSVIGGQAEVFENPLMIVGRNKILESDDPNFSGFIAIWAYVFYEDVFGNFYRSGGRFIAAKPVGRGKPGVWNYFADTEDPVFEERPDKERQR